MLGSFYYDLTAATTAVQLQGVLDLVPASQLLMGVDIPFMPQFTIGAAIDAVERYSGFSPEDLQKIARGKCRALVSAAGRRYAGPGRLRSTCRLWRKTLAGGLGPRCSSRTWSCPSGNSEARTRLHIGTNKESTTCRQRCRTTLKSEPWLRTGCCGATPATGTACAPCGMTTEPCRQPGSTAPRTSSSPPAAALGTAAWRSCTQ